MNPRRVRARRFIPDGDHDCAAMLRQFAAAIEREPGRYRVSAGEVQRVGEAVRAYRDALAVATRVDTRTALTIMDKDGARAEAERVVRRCARLIRANDQITVADKLAAGIRPRPWELTPEERKVNPLGKARSGAGAGVGAPVVWYVGSRRGRHVLRFRDELGMGTSAKPRGAVRLELFVGLVRPDEPVPTRPCDEPWSTAACGGPGASEAPAPTPGRGGNFRGVDFRGRGYLRGYFRGWYVRSFTRNPIEVTYPLAYEPMLVVYWGRWADSRGDVGPWSKTAVARIEGRCPASPDG